MGENTTATLHAVMQMFPHLRAVEDLEPLPLSEAEVILGSGLVVVESHKQSHSCGETTSDMWWWSVSGGELYGCSIVSGFSLWFYCWVFVHLSHTWAACYVTAI